MYINFICIIAADRVLLLDPDWNVRQLLIFVFYIHIMLYILHYVCMRKTYTYYLYIQPQTDLQARERSWRLGQTRPV